jgi:hypothetical protein
MQELILCEIVVLDILGQDGPVARLENGALVDGLGSQPRSGEDRTATGNG